MLNIRFEAQGEEYRRIITFPAGNISEDLISIPPQWHTVEPYPWIRPLHEYDRPELEAKGGLLPACI
ncbi:MAG: hypothetical protein U1D97_16025 [Desulfuromonadales bacterium]|nr:hypothetical protein [Desulfuromonadales bacterium]